MQNELPLEKRFTKKQITLILTLASMLGLIAAFVLTLIPSPAEALAMELVNLKEDYAYWETIKNNAEEHMTEIAGDALPIREELGF